MELLRSTVTTFYAHDTRILSGLEPVRLAAPCVTHDVAQLVVLSVLAVRARHLLPRIEHAHCVVFALNETSVLHRAMDTVTSRVQHGQLYRCSAADGENVQFSEVVDHE
jgi:hypothetical protein